MRRIALCLLLFTFMLPPLTAGIKVKKDGKILLVEFHYPQATDLFGEGILSLDDILSDIKEALEAASAQKCNTVILYDNKHQILKIIKDKDKIRDVHGTLEMMRAYIEEMGYTEEIPGKVIGTRREQTEGAKYRQETYINGSLHDVYEASWSQGPFQTKTSTLWSGGNAYKTITFYVPPSIKTVEIREPSTMVKVEGSKVFAEKVYFR